MRYELELKQKINFHDLEEVNKKIYFFTLKRLMRNDLNLTKRWTFFYLGDKLRQLGCPIAWGNHVLVRATIIYILLAWPGKCKAGVCSNLITQVTNIKNHVFSYKPSTYSDFLTWHILFCYSGMFRQAVLWPKLPDQAIKKKENCHSLFGEVNKTSTWTSPKEEVKISIWT